MAVVANSEWKRIASDSNSSTLGAHDAVYAVNAAASDIDTHIEVVFNAHAILNVCAVLSPRCRGAWAKLTCFLIDHANERVEGSDAAFIRKSSSGSAVVTLGTSISP